jgi:catechol 2,3-dioxygenase-like lactoylglutathione lyase family enzyme/predicted enzyme related to lactoylglutathione lyase
MSFSGLTLVLSMLVSASWAQVKARPAITGLAFVRVYSSDAGASAKFYGEVLGYDHAGQSGLGRYAVNDAQWVEVVAMPAPAPQAKVAAIGFTTRDVRALEKYIKAEGVPIVEPLQGGRFGVHDPEGRLVIFVQQAAVQGKLSPRAGSHRIIHTGFTVKDRDVEDKFYKQLLGFKPYWYGGRKDRQLDYVSMQVPEGTDWVEYMLGPEPQMDAHQLGSANHMSLGVAHIEDAIVALKKNGCEGADCTNTHVGRNGTMQLNVFDPDLTRVEYMEFDPVEEPCCSPFTGPHPMEQESR